MTFKYDLSLPLDHFYAFVEDCREKVQDLALTSGFGHIGDGNLHLNVWMHGYEDKEKANKIVETLEPWIFKKVQQCNGSISAEHGIGYMKASKLHYNRDSAMINTMKIIKNSFDPHGILNPYKVIPN